MYINLSFPSETSATELKLSKIPKILAILSILTYFADSKIISLDVAIAVNICSANKIIAMANMEYIKNEIKSPVFNLFVNRFLSLTTFPTK